MDHGRGRSGALPVIGLIALFMAITASPDIAAQLQVHREQTGAPMSASALAALLATCKPQGEDVRAAERAIWNAWVNTHDPPPVSVEAVEAAFRAKRDGIIRYDLTWEVTRTIDMAHAPADFLVAVGSPRQRTRRVRVARDRDRLYSEVVEQHDRAWHAVRARRARVADTEFLHRPPEEIGVVRPLGTDRGVPRDAESWLAFAGLIGDGDGGTATSRFADLAAFLERLDGDHVMVEPALDDGRIVLRIGLVTGARIWLDPRRGLAPIRLNEQGADGVVIDVTMSDFVSVGSHVWLPRHVEYRQRRQADVAPYVAEVFRLDAWSVNAPVDASLFDPQQFFPRGTIVEDMAHGTRWCAGLDGRAFLESMRDELDAFR